MWIDVMGSVNKRGRFEISPEKTIKEILMNWGEGLKNSRKLKLAQVGGPLGMCLKGVEINNTLESYKEHMTGEMILFLDELMCPVDYLRFLTRFLIRELKVDNSFTRNLNKLTERIANGEGNRLTIEEIKLELEERVIQNLAEERTREIFLYFMENFTEEIEEHIVDKKCRNSICRGLMEAQCINACPGEVYVPGYVELMKRGRIEEAYSLMRKNNPLSFICGKVCARPCESRCRRGEIEKTVGARALKRYAAEMALQSEEYAEDKLDPKGKKVAVVGAGPAGLTAAYYLAKTGYEVVVYEAEEKVGGMLAMGIPEYRLPQESIDREVELIRSLGVEIFTGIKIGQDIQLSQLKEDYDAVLLSTGCHVGNIIPNTQAEGVETAIKILKEVKLGNRKTIGERTLVVGGGDVAMDAARTAVRLGSKDVKVISLEDYQEMPASEEEKEGALQEGVEFLNGYGMDRVNIEKGRVVGLKIKKCLSVLDDDYRFSPEYDETDTVELDVDSLIYAIGQKPDLSYVDCMDTVDMRFIAADRFKTAVEGIYAAGDMCGPGTAIEAIAQAKKAAGVIDEYLGGKGLYDGEDIEIPKTTLDCTTWDQELTEEKTISAESRKDNFCEIEKTYTCEEAIAEAGRCMRCDRNSRKKLYLK